MDEQDKMPGRKSQVATELIIVTAIVLVSFLIMSVIIDDKNTQVIEYRKSLSAKELCDMVAYYINDVYISGFGATREIQVPVDLLDGTDFNLTIVPSSRMVNIEWGDLDYHASILTSRVQGNLTLTYGIYNIYNSHGVIDVSG